MPFIRDGELVLNESNTIVSYLANKYNRDGIYPESPEDLATAWQWLGERHPTPPHSRTSVAHRSGGSGVGGHAGRQAEAGRPTGLRLRGVCCTAEFGEQFLVPRTNPVFFGAVRGMYAPSLNKTGTPPAEEIEAAVPRCVVSQFRAIEKAYPPAL